MLEYRVEQQIISRNHPKWAYINEMCYHSKNLYNHANYIVREEFVNNHLYTRYSELKSQLQKDDLYKACMSQPANCVLRRLDKTWKSFFVAIKDWKKNPQKYNGMPKLPKYLNKKGRFVWEIPNNSCYIEDNEVHFRIRKLQNIKWKTKAKGRLLQVRFVPRGCDYVMEIVTEVEINPPIRENNNIVGIDLGVNNFVTMTNNIGKQPIIINGKGLKSINQYFNKKRASIMGETIRRNNQHWSLRLSKLTNKRFNKVKNFMHHASRFVVNYCLDNNISTVVCGLNSFWKQEANMGHQNNQNFIFIPYDMFIRQLRYKCKEAGIRFLTTDESYTSGTSFLDNEEPIKENYNKSRRIKRGLFRTNDGRLINSDVNGSLQIIKKVFPNTFADGIQGYLTPSIINVI